MSSTTIPRPTLPLPDTTSVPPALWQEVSQLIKPRLSLMVLITMAVGGWVASWGQPDASTLINAIMGTSLVAASASVWNQWIERRTDALMPRTANRPLASRRMSSTHVLISATLALLLGLGQLHLFVNPLTAGLGLTTWLLYVFVYTPLKRISRWNTLVGAIPGALPVLMGWSATGEAFDGRALAIFLLLFFWQFPHFMSIAWRCREQYANAGLQMVTVTDPSGRRAGLQAVAGALALLPVSLVATLMSPPSVIAALVACGASGWLVYGAFRFLRERNDQTARRLLHISLIYLPGMMLALACLPFSS